MHIFDKFHFLLPFFTSVLCCHCSETCLSNRMEEKQMEKFEELFKYEIKKKLVLEEAVEMEESHG